MSLIEQPRPLREPSPPLDLIIDLHPDDVDAPAFVPVHLREAEPTPPAETITQILAEPPSAPEQAPEPAAAEVPEVVQEAEETLPEASSEEAAPEQTPQPRKKKRRGRRQRRRNRSSTADGDSGSTPQNESGSPATSDNPFGAGVDS